jgi:hypothetical protein
LGKGGGEMKIRKLTIIGFIMFLATSVSASITTDFSWIPTTFVYSANTTIDGVEITLTTDTVPFTYGEGWDGRGAYIQNHESDLDPIVTLHFSVPIENVRLFIEDLDYLPPYIPDILTDFSVAPSIAGGDFGIRGGNTIQSYVNQGDGNLHWFNLNDDTISFKWYRNYGGGLWLSELEISFASPPTIEAILEFFDESVANNTLEGDGPGNSANSRLNAFRNMLESSFALINIGDIEGACLQLNNILLKCDGVSPPEDFVIGSSVTELNNMIMGLMSELGCD